MNICKIICLLVISITAFGQNKEGYWDNVRTTNETLTLGAGKKEFIKTADFPEGTTEVVFRISLLDDNQKLTSSLISVLKAIPDPTGISQGSAGAVLLLSTISGTDKCKYAVFSNEKDAEEHEKSGDAKKACIKQDNPVNKDAKLLSANSKCIFNGTKNLWFAFESDNWVMNEKIVLEVVPWVNYKLSRGWNNETKKEIVTICKGLDVMSLVDEKEIFCGYFLDLISQSYTYKEFKNLLPEEKAKVINEFSEKTLTKTGENKVVAQTVRNKAIQLFDSGKQQEAINLLQSKLIKTNIANVDDYNLFGKYYLLTKQFDKALKVFKKAEQMDASDLEVKLNMAHAYLLTDEFKKAKEIHKAHQNQNISADVSWKQQTEKDFTQFRSKDIVSKDFDKILNILE